MLQLILLAMNSIQLSSSGAVKTKSSCTLKCSVGWWVFTPCNKIQKLAFLVAWELGSILLDLFEAFLKKQM